MKNEKPYPVTVQVGDDVVVVQPGGELPRTPAADAPLAYQPQPLSGYVAGPVPTPPSFYEVSPAMGERGPQPLDNGDQGQAERDEAESTASVAPEERTDATPKTERDASRPAKTRQRDK